MQKQVILIMESQYPFGGYEHKGCSTITKTLVRQILSTRSLQERNQILQKIALIQNLQMKELIKIQTVLEEESSVHILYEYVPIQILSIIKNMQTSFFQKIKEDLINLGIQLAQLGILINWSLNNLGLDKNFKPKYYLDINKMQMSKKYKPEICIQQVNKILQPYLSQPISRQLKEEKCEKIRKNSSAPSIQDVQAFYKKQNSLMKKNQENKKTVEKNKGKNSKNWRELSHDEEIMKDFINVLDDKQQNEKNVLDEQEEEVIWNEPSQKYEENEQRKLNSKQIRNKAEQAIKRSKRVMKVFKQLIQKN